MKTWILIAVLSLTPLFASEATTNPLATMDLFELTNLNDKCITARLRFVAAQFRAQATIIENSSFLAGFSKDSAARMINGVASGTEQLSQQTANSTYSICAFVQKEYNKRLAE